MFKNFVNYFKIQNNISFKQNNKIFNLQNLKLFTLFTGSSIYIYNSLENNKINCLFGFSSSNSKIKSKVSILQFNANDPIEDRLDYKSLVNIEGDAIVVMDGHGGWQLSDFAKNNLISNIDNNFKAISFESYLEKNNLNNTQEVYDLYISDLIKMGFEKVESDFKEIALQSYNVGMAKLSSVGSCCLFVLVHNNKAYSANLGDSEGYIFSSNGAIKLNNTLNADNPVEQRRLKNNFKDEEDIFICKDKKRNKSCYVKGRLQPTSAFGDFHLKFPEFNNPKNVKCRKS